MSEQLRTLEQETIPKTESKKQSQSKQKKGLNVSEQLGQKLPRVTKKILIHPNEEQLQLFDILFGGHRYFYNKTLDYISDNNLDTTKTLDKTRLRAAVIVNDCDLKPNDEEFWTTQIPSDTRDYGVRKVADAYKTCNQLKNRGHIREFTLKRRSKKNSNQIFYLKGNAARIIDNNIFIFQTRLKNNYLRIDRKYRAWFRKNIRNFTAKQGNRTYLRNVSSIIKQKDKYYITILFDKKVTKLADNNLTISLDPGVRTFQTGYTENSCEYLGKDFAVRLKIMSKRIDKLNKIEKQGVLFSSKTRRNLRKKCTRLRTKIRNTVEDFQYKLVKYLTTRYNTIILPKFSSKQIAMSSKNHSLNRYAYMLAHFRFRQKLIARCNELGRNIIICKENHTSQTCGNCGFRNKSLGPSEVYDCPKCKMVLNRDANGARNILIRVLTKYHVSTEIPKGLKRGIGRDAPVKLEVECETSRSDYSIPGVSN